MASHRPLFDLTTSETVRLRYAPGTGEDLVISFSSIGRKRGEMPPDEFRGTVLSDPTRHALFVSDIRRSWLNDAHLCDALAGAVEGIRQNSAIKRVSTIGLSMGGFSALAASALFPVHAALAISPQFSMVPGKIPGETRWRYWRKQIKVFRFETAEVTPAPGWALTLHGLLDDRSHMAAFSPRRGLDQFGFPDETHSGLGGYLRDRNMLAGLLAAAIAHDRRQFARLIKSSGGGWRHTVLAQAASQ